MTRRMKWLFAAFILLCGFNPVLASTNSAFMGVSATVTAGCSSLSVSQLNFGTLPASNQKVSASANVSITCAAGVPYTVNIGNGNNSAGQARRMSDGGVNLLDYEIYTDVSHNQPWHDGQNGTFNLTGTGTGLAVSVQAYGLASPLTSQVAGSYTDRVQVDLNF